jgi:hypothetical protein
MLRRAPCFDERRVERVSGIERMHSCVSVVCA